MERQQIKFEYHQIENGFTILNVDKSFISPEDWKILLNLMRKKLPKKPNKIKKSCRRRINCPDNMIIEEVEGKSILKPLKYKIKVQFGRVCTEHEKGDLNLPLIEKSLKEANNNSIVVINEGRDEESNIRYFFADVDEEIVKDIEKNSMTIACEGARRWNVLSVAL